MLKLIILSVLFLLSTLNAFGQKNASNINNQESKDFQKLEQRLDILEGQKENLDKQSEILKLDFDSKARELDVTLNEHKLEVEQKTSIISLFLDFSAVGLFATCISIFVILLSYIRYFIKKTSEEKAEKMIEEKIANIIEENEEKIVSLIEKYDTETRLKRESNLLVIVEDKNEQKYMEMLFLEIGILNVQFIIGNSYVSPDPNIDLIIFNDRKDTKNNHGVFEEYLNKVTRKDILFIFYGNHFNIPDGKELNFANSKYTLYDRIMNSLKFRYSSKKNNISVNK